jgi:hypothetical protein
MAFRAPFKFALPFTVLLGILAFIFNASCSSPRKTIPLVKCGATEKYDDTTKKCVAKSGGGLEGGGGGGGDQLEAKCDSPKFWITVGSTRECVADETEAQSTCRARLQTKYIAQTLACEAPAETQCLAANDQYQHPDGTTSGCLTAAQAQEYCTTNSYRDGFSKSTGKCFGSDDEERRNTCTTSGLVPDPLDSTAPCVLPANAKSRCEGEIKNGSYGQYDSSYYTCTWPEPYTELDPDYRQEPNPDWRTPGKPEDPAAKTLDCPESQRLYSGESQICCPRILKIKLAPANPVIAANAEASGRSGCPNLTLAADKYICSTGSLLVNPASPAGTVMFKLSFWQLPGTKESSSCVYQTDALGDKNLEEVTP